MSIQKTSPASPKEVLEDFLTSFVPTDNFEVDEADMRQVVAEAMASLLIRHRLTSDSFLHFFKGQVGQDGFSFHLHKVYKYVFQTKEGRYHCEISGFRVNSAHAKKISENIEAGWQASPQVPRYRIEPVVASCQFIDMQDNPNKEEPPYGQPLYPTIVTEIKKWFQYKFANLYRLFEYEIEGAKKRSPEDLWRKMTGEPLELCVPVKKSILGISPVDFAFGENCGCEQWAKQHDPNWQRCSLDDPSHWLLQQIADQGLYPEAFPWICKDFLVKFKNCYNEIESGFFVWHDFKEQNKTLAPVTTFPIEYSGRKFVATVPPPDKKLQLFNLDKICTDIPKNILITDSLQIAALNTEWLERRGWIITSFLCLDGNSDAVDWEPLTNGDYAIQGIYYLITNHSGISLEEAYQKAYDFQHVQEGEGFRLRIPDLHYLQLAIQYPDYRSFASLKDFLDFSKENQPLCVEDSNLFMDESKFLEIYQRTMAPSRPFWETPEAPKPEQKKESASTEPIPYLLRPALRRGQITMLYAPKGRGKSLLALCMGMAVVAAGQDTYQVFKEMWWRAIPHLENRTPIPRKVLYLAFEQSDRVERRFKEKRGKIWKTKAKECEPNFIIEAKMPKMNYLASENQPELLKRIDQATQEGNPGQPVDLVIIDTLISCVNSSNLTDIGQRIRELRVEIQKRNLALLIVHHSNAEGANRGGEDVLNSVDLTIRLANCRLSELGKDDKDKSHLTETNITKPFGIIRLNGNEANDWIESRFDGKFKDEDENWHVDCGSETPEIYEAKKLKEVVAHYKSRGFTHEVTAKMLGASDNTLRKKEEEAEALLKKNNVK